MLSLLSLLTIFLAAISSASAQTSSQQYVYASAPGSPNPSSVPAFSKTSATGALNLVPGSPFNERLEGGLLAIDGQGKFLFVLNPTSDDISMFQIDQASGDLSEVPGSPFAFPPIFSTWFPPCQPLSIVASGQFVFVGYFYANCGDSPANGGNNQGSSAVASLAIDTTGSTPVLNPVTSIFPQTGGSPIQLFTDSRGLHLYVGVGVSVTGMQASGPEVYSIDGAGNLLFEGTASNPENNGFDYAIDPQDRFVFAAGGASAAFHLLTCGISPVDGTANSCSLLLLASSDSFGMLVESSGHFLYIPDFAQNVGVYSIDQTTGVPTQVATLPGVVLNKGNSVADPMGPYIYSANLTSPGAVHAYLVDQQTGNLTEIPGSPFNPGTSACCQGLAITGNPVQAISGPAATIFPSTAAHFFATAGTTSSTQLFSIVNIGNQLLTFSSILIAGTDASSFSETNTCLATLAPTAHCSISINFSPATAGTFTATLQVADNAPGSPQTLALNGTGLAPVPAISFSPSSLLFPAPPFAATTQGTSSAPQTLTVLSTGNTTLHISTVSLSGPNPSDFSFTNNCPATLAPSANCTISVVFNPIAPGQRTASLAFSTDAPGSPQIVSLSGTAVSAVSGGAATGGSTTAAVSAGQTAQYQLQLTPGPGFTGTVSLTCSGAPPGAVCQVPASVTVANGVATPFNVTVTTSGAALLPPYSPLRFPPISRVPPLAPLSLSLLLLLFVGFSKNRGAFERAARVSRLALYGVFSAAIFCATIGLMGCGGGSTAAPPPPPVVTPSGTSTITVSLGATSSSGQPLQLQPIQLTLTVK